MTEHIATYLNDHLAGSVAGLAILDYILEKSRGTPDEAILTRIQVDIEEDKEALEALIEKLDISESAFRKASAWVGEKMAELKLRFDDPSAGPFLIFDSLEALSLGIEGKRSLWRMLSHSLAPETAVGSFDLETLINERKISARSSRNSASRQDGRPLGRNNGKAKR